jgi:hypothetical protein
MESVKRRDVKILDILELHYKVGSLPKKFNAQKMNDLARAGWD